VSGRREGSRLPAGPPDPTDEPPPSPSPPLVHRDPITVMLVDKAAVDLQITHERTNMSKTDIINRAVSLYEFVDAEIRAGAELIIRRDGQDYLVKLM
jgi:hypothetical protein